MYEGEQWRNVAGFDGYQVSDHGRVRSLDRAVACGYGVGFQLRKGRVLKPVGLQGYRRVGLHSCGKGKYLRVHRLVAAAFLGDSVLQVNHKNGVRDDNRLENLEWVTQSENTQHSYDVLGNKAKAMKGEEHGRSKLTEANVLEIRERYASGGIFQRELAAEFSVSRMAVSHIVNRKLWKHIA